MFRGKVYKFSEVFETLYMLWIISSRIYIVMTRARSGQLRSRDDGTSCTSKIILERGWILCQPVWGWAFSSLAAERPWGVCKSFPP